MADPLNEFTKALKVISSKKKKTDADYEEMNHIQFLGSLYMDENGPVLPAYVIEAMAIEGAKKSREGTLAKSGCFCTDHAFLEYDGPRTAKELWSNEKFHFPYLVRIGMAKVMSMRPIFNSWNAMITLNVEDTTINVDRVTEWLVVAGTQVGVGDWRPKYGRFTVKKI
jgi:hypothetical protein